jgi:hypothetical protein
MESVHLRSKLFQSLDVACELLGTLVAQTQVIKDSGDPTSDVGLGLTLGFGACKESAPGSPVVVVQSMISFIVANTRKTTGLDTRTIMTMIVESV